MDIQSETAEGTIKIKPTWYRNPKNKLQKPTTTEGIRFSLKILITVLAFWYNERFVCLLEIKNTNYISLKKDFKNSTSILRLNNLSKTILIHVTHFQQYYNQLGYENNLLIYF